MWPGRVLNLGPLVIESEALPTAPDSLADQESNLTFVLLSLSSFSIELNSLRKDFSTVKGNPTFYDKTPSRYIYREANKMSK